MKRVTVLGKERAGIATGQVPQARENWAVIKVHAAPMCTEYKAFAAGTNRGFYGHEAAGEVVAVAQPGKVKVGDRVVAMPMSSCGQCAYCLAGEYIHCQDAIDFDAYHGSGDGKATMSQYLLKQDWMLAANSPGHVLRTCVDGLLRLGTDLRRFSIDSCRCARYGADHGPGTGGIGRRDRRNLLAARV